ncbi:MAG: PAS domain-containing sensor histidine kinase [Desulfomonilaceae bacterium]
MTTNGLEKYYKRVFDNAGVGILAVNRENRIIEANQALLTMLGYDKEDLCERSFLDITHPDDRGISSRSMAALMAGEITSYRFEKRYLRSDHSILWGDVSTTGILGEIGQPIQAIAVVVDVTKLKESEQALRNREEHYRGVFDNAGVGIDVLDRDGKIMEVNRALLQMLGYQESELLQRTFFDITHPGDREMSNRSLESLMSGERSSYRFEKRYLKKDGSVLWVDLSTTCIKSEDDKPAKVVGVIVDISKRKKAEEELRHYSERLEEMVEQRTAELSASENRFRDLVESMSDLVWELDQNGIFKYFSPRMKDLLGYEPEDALGATFPRFMSKKEEERLSGTVKSIFSSRKPFRGLETKHVHKDGHNVFLETSGVPIINTQGEFLGYRGVCRDITERKQAEEALRQRTKDLERSNKDLEQFAYVAAHDLREPLVAIGAYLKVLERLTRNTLVDAGKNCLDKTINLVLRMDNMLQGLLAYSRLTLTPMSYELTDCNACLADALSNLGPSIKQSEAIVTHDDLPTVRMNGSQLVLIFQNLIGNAIKYRGLDPLRIHVGCTSTESEFEFLVSDNGIGIDPPYLDRIFNMFERVKELSGPSGTGIGLSTCKKIVERYGGRIWVESIVGKGSTFHFTLPKE